MTNRYAQHVTIDDTCMTIIIYGRLFSYELESLKSFADDFYEGEGCFIAKQYIKK